MKFIRLSHRADLKPENILMHATGHVLLTDFDLSKHATNPVQPKIVTKIYSGGTGVVSEPDLITNRYASKSDLSTLYYFEDCSSHV